MTAHGNYKTVTEHGGLAWTPEKVLGKQILIINSYHEGDDKTDNLMKGIYAKFMDYELSTDFSIEYLDTKRYPYDSHLQNLENVFKYKYANKRLDVIITSGNEALEYVIKYRPELFQNTPIVFSGVTNPDLEKIHEHKGITGVIESIDALATINIALKLHPDAHKVILLSPGKNNKNIISEYKGKHSNQIKFLYWDDLYLSDIEKKIETLGKDVILLPLTEPRTKSGKSIPYETFVERLANISNAIVYSLWDSALGFGTVGGKVISGYAQGYKAASLAVDVLRGIDISNIPVVLDSPNVYMFDNKKLEFYGVDTRLLPVNSTLINKPYSIYDNYRQEINIAILLLLTQAGIIFLLLLANKRRKKAENELKTINDELESRIQKRTKQLSLSEEKFSKSFLTCPDALTITSLEDGCLIEVNEAFEDMSGYSRDEAIGKTTVELKIWPDPAAREYCINKLQTEGTLREYEVKMMSKSGDILDMSISGDIIYISGKPCMLVTARNITDKKRADMELRRYEKIIASTNDFISYIDKDYIFQAANKTYLDSFRLIRNEIIGHTVPEIHGYRFFNESVKPNIDRCFEGATVNVQYWMEIVVSGRRYFDVVYSPYMENGEIMGAVVSARDITPTHVLSKKLSYQASHDSLTGLINRREFENRLQRVLDNIKLNSDYCVLSYMDLDQFKVINDTFGHAAGDELLRQLAELLKKNIRQRDTLARLGGDEFAALFEHCTLQQAHRIIDKFLKIINEFRFEWEGKTFGIGISIGLVPVDKNAGHLDEILKKADAACYTAKNEGRNRIHIYEENDSRIVQLHGDMKWIAYVQEALDKDRFCLYKQHIFPLNNIDESDEEHFEVLLRLQSDDGLILPGTFLPSSEQYGLSSKIDSWVIRNFFEWLVEIPERQQSISLCTINLSGYSLAAGNLLNDIIHYLESMPVIPGKICFEITETAAIANYEKASYFIKELRKRGCRFALDDFGSGFSSFTHLRNLKIDFLKIEGMFVRDILTDPIAFSMVRTINEIGHLFGIKTVAECVENDQILEKLREINVDYVQGYGIGIPQPLDEPAGKRPSPDQKEFTVHNSSSLKH